MIGEKEVMKRNLICLLIFIYILRMGLAIAENSSAHDENKSTGHVVLLAYDGNNKPGITLPEKKVFFPIRVYEPLVSQVLLMMVLVLFITPMIARHIEFTTDVRQKMRRCMSKVFNGSKYKDGAFAC